MMSSNFETNTADNSANTNAVTSPSQIKKSKKTEPSEGQQNFRLSSGGRKIQFRWNATKDLFFLTELEQIEKSQPLCRSARKRSGWGTSVWIQLAESVNQKFEANIDYIATKRRFDLLLSELKDNNFKKDRYKSGPEEYVTDILDKLANFAAYTCNSFGKDDEDVEQLSADNSAEGNAVPRLFFGEKEGRKIQFRWNSTKDYVLLAEIDKLRPFLKLTRSERSDLWEQVTENVRNILNADIDSVATKRRFNLLLNEFQEEKFRTDRYKSDPKGHVKKILRILAECATLITDTSANDELVYVVETQNQPLNAQDNPENSNQFSGNNINAELLSTTPLDCAVQVNSDSSSCSITDDNSESSDETRRDRNRSRKVQFRWNSAKDLILLKEIAEIQPYLERDKEKWIRVTKKVRKKLNADIDSLATRRRFCLLLNEFKENKFNESRYKSGSKNNVSEILRILASCASSGTNRNEDDNLFSTDVSANYNTSSLTYKDKQNQSDSEHLDIISPNNSDSDSDAEMGGRKTPFKWNSKTDIFMLSELEKLQELLKPRGSGKTKAWFRVTDCINEKFNANITYVGTKRRFTLLLNELKNNRFGHRYRTEINSQGSKVWEKVNRLSSYFTTEDDEEDMVYSGNETSNKQFGTDSDDLNANSARRTRTKVPFKWNSAKDLCMLTDVERCFRQGTKGSDMWKQVAICINESFNTNMLRDTAKRRFCLLLDEIEENNFKDRYRSDTDNCAEKVFEKLKNISCLMDTDDERELVTTASTAADENETQTFATDATSRLSFKWNSEKDLCLLTEAERLLRCGIIKSPTLWRQISDCINAKFNADIRYVAPKRRFHLLLNEFQENNFRDRYWADTEDYSTQVIEKLSGLSTLIASKSNDYNLLTSLSDTIPEQTFAEEINILGQQVNPFDGNNDTRDFIDGEGCLICCDTISRRPGTNSTFPSLPGSLENNHINKQLWAIFTLRILLKYPKLKCDELLRHVSNPDSWFDLCEICESTVKSAMDVYHKILKLEKSLKALQDECRMRIENGISGDENVHQNNCVEDGIISVSKYIRGFFKDPNMELLIPKSETAEHAYFESVEENDDASSRIEDDDNEDEVPFDTAWTLDSLGNAGEDGDPLYIPGRTDICNVNSHSGQSSQKRRRKDILIPRTEDDDVLRVSTQPKPKPRKDRHNADISTQLQNISADILSRNVFIKKEVHPTQTSYYHCKSCPQKYSNKEYLIKHKKAHATSKFVCEICNFPSQDELGKRIHLKYKHNVHGGDGNTNTETSLPKGLYKCSKCSEQFPNCSSFLKHQRTHNSKGKKHICKICSFPATSSYKLSSHMSRHHRHKYHCTLCDAKFMYRSLLSEHKREHHIKEEDELINDSETVNLPITVANEESHNQMLECVIEDNVLKDPDWSPENVTNSDRICKPKHTHRKARRVCGICKRTYTSMDSYQRHLYDHKINRQFVCQKCNYPCASSRVLARHISRENCYVKQYKCKMCDFFAKSMKTLRIHQQTHPDLKAHKNKIKTKRRRDGKVQPIACQLCCTRFPTVAEFVAHAKCHETNKDFTCHECNFPCSSASDFQNHTNGNICNAQLKDANLFKFKCTKCPFSVEQKFRLEDHLRAHTIFDGSETSDGKFNCSLCNATFINSRQLSVHKREVHGTELGLTSYRCQLCPKAYSRIASLRDHVSQDHKKKCRFYCDVCGFGMMHKNTLEKHKRKHESVKSFVCEICGSDYTYKQGLRKHMRERHSDKRNPNNAEIRCKYCAEEVILQNRLELNIHLKSVHRDLYTYKCDECENTYLSVASLQLHKKVNHGKNSQAECQFCGKKVISQVYLYPHYKKYCKKKPPGFEFSLPGVIPKRRKVNKPAAQPCTTESNEQP